MLLGDFFEILEINRKENSVGVKININNKHSVFAGHFPGQPVVPGVCLTQMTVETLSKALNKPLQLTKGNNIKFLNVVDPTVNQILLFDITYQATNQQQFAVNCVAKNDIQSFFKFKGVLNILES